MNSSISPSSRNDAMIPAPPIIQMSFPFFFRRRFANALIGSLTNSTPAGAVDSGTLACENVILDPGIRGRPGRAFLLKVERHIVCLPAPKDRVDRFIERTHAVVPLRTRTIEPVDRAIRPANKAIGTRGDVNNDFPFVNHGATVPLILMPNVREFPSRGVRESRLLRPARAPTGLGFIYAHERAASRLRHLWSAESTPPSARQGIPSLNSSRLI